MNKIWEFFDTMDELVYVSDVDSYELVYMNQKALRTYGNPLKKSFPETVMKFSKTALYPVPCVITQN